MKTSIFLIALALVDIKAYAENLPAKEIAITVSDVYVPSGFDTKSEAYVVVNGLFPNTCYSMSQAKISNKSLMEHEVQTIASVKPGICIRVFVPFTKEIPLGVLAKGQHTLRFVADDRTSFEKTLNIE